MQASVHSQLPPNAHLSQVCLSGTITLYIIAIIAPLCACHVHSPYWCLGPGSISIVFLILKLARLIITLIETAEEIVLPLGINVKANQVVTRRASTTIITHITQHYKNKEPSLHGLCLL